MTVPGWDAPYLILSAAEPTCSACCCLLRDSWTVSRYFSIMSRLTNYLYTHILAGLCLRIYITLDHYTGRRLYTSHRLLNISSRKLMSFVWPIDSSSSSTSHYAVSRMWLQTFCESIQPATSLFAFHFVVVLRHHSRIHVCIAMKYSNSTTHPPPPQRFEVMGVIGFLGFSKLRLEL